MNYEKEYKEALQKIRELIEKGKEKGWTIITYEKDFEEIFPELKSEDEKIRKALVEMVHDTTGDELWVDYNVHKEEALAWLEKQAERKTPQWMIDFLDNYRRKIGCSLDYDEARDVDGRILCIKEWLEKQGEKPVDKVEPKFKVGNWYQCTKDFFGKGVTFDKNTAYYCAKEGCLQNEYGCHIAIVKDLYDNFKLWTIHDAKDGDILVFNKPTNNDTIVIFKNLYNATSFHSYCYVEDGEFFISHYETPDWWRDGGFQPATKEQRQFLFQKMKEAGYEWDAEMKEPKKIEQNPAWSEEDERLLNATINTVLIGRNSCEEDDDVKDKFDEELNWLESLKQRIGG